MAENVSRHVGFEIGKSPSAQHAFVNLIIAPLHPEPFVGLLRSRVVTLNIEANTADISCLFGFSHDVRVKRFENSLAARGLIHVDTLQPPEVAVAPVAPLIRDQHLADEVFTEFRNKISPFGWIADQSFDTGANGCRIEANVFSLMSQERIEIGNDFNVPQFSFSDNGIDEIRILARDSKSIFDATASAHRFAWDKREKRLRLNRPRFQHKCLERLTGCSMPQTHFFSGARTHLDNGCPGSRIARDEDRFRQKQSTFACAVGTHAADSSGPSSC